MQNERITLQGPIQVPIWSVLIKQKRLELKESQKVFGQRWGVSHASVSDWERAVNDPPAEVLWWLMNGLQDE